MSRYENKPKVVYAVSADSYGQYIGIVIMVGIALAIGALLVGFMAIVILIAPLIASTVVGMPSYIMFYYWYRFGKNSTEADALSTAQNLLRDGRIEEAYFAVSANKHDALISEWLKEKQLSTMDRISLAFRLRGFLLAICISLLLLMQPLTTTFPMIQWVGMGFTVMIAASIIFQLFRVNEIQSVMNKASQYVSDEKKIAYAKSLFKQSKKEQARYVLYITHSEHVTGILRKIGRASSYRYSNWYMVIMNVILLGLVVIAGMITIGTVWSYLFAPSG